MSGNVVHLNFGSRPVRHEAVAQSPSFALETGGGQWSLHPAEVALTPAELVAAADCLREIARSLTEMAHRQAGLPGNRCLAEFVLFENGGIDHWISPQVETAHHRLRVKLGLRNAISSIRE